MSIPDALSPKERDLAWLEFKLELNEFMKWAFEVIRGDIKARWITQREKYLQEEVHSLHKSLSLSTDDEKAWSRLKEYEEELQSLKKANYGS